MYMQRATASAGLEATTWQALVTANARSGLVLPDNQEQLSARLLLGRSLRSSKLLGDGDAAFPFNSFPFGKKLLAVAFLMDLVTCRGLGKLKPIEGEAIPFLAQPALPGPQDLLLDVVDVQAKVRENLAGGSIADGPNVGILLKGCALNLCTIRQAGEVGKGSVAVEGPGARRNV